MKRHRRREGSSEWRREEFRIFSSQNGTGTKQKKTQKSVTKKSTKKTKRSVEMLKTRIKYRLKYLLPFWTGNGLSSASNTSFRVIGLLPRSRLHSVRQHTHTRSYYIMHKWLTYILYDSIIPRSPSAAATINRNANSSSPYDPNAGLRDRNNWADGQRLRG